MRRFLGLAVALALLLSLTVSVSAAPSSPTVRVFVRGTAEARGAALAVVAPRHTFERSFSAEAPAALLPHLQAIPGIHIETVGTFTIDGAPVETSSIPTAKVKTSATRSAYPTDPTPWGIESIYSDQAITASSGGAGVIVAILDTGVAPHIDLKPAKQLKDFTAPNGVKNGVAKDLNGHGTHVTGTILAGGGPDGLGIWGVAPQADYFAYKVLGASGSGSWDDLAVAIRTAADNGANIISMSLGGSSAPVEVLDAIRYAVGKGVLVVAAAGNSGPAVDTIDYPGAYAEVAAVAAIGMISGSTGAGDSTTLSNLRITSFSSRGKADSSGADGIQDREVELAAPGLYVESTAKDGGYVVYSGTSMATPHIAGLAAKMWQGSGSATRTWLVNQAQKYDITQADGGGATAGYDYATGYGGPRVK